MQTVEVTGKSLQEAKDNAAKQLGVTVDQLQVVVLEEHKGLFGKATVRIRAELNGSGPEAPAPEKEVEAEAVAKPVKERAPRSPRAPKAAAPQPEKTVETEETPAAASEEQHEPVSQALEATEEDAKRLLALLQDVLKAGSLEVTAKATGTSGRYVNIEIDGKDVAFLVGKHGEVLNALQYVLNIMANQQFGNGIRATLDGNDYRHRREEALTKLATKIADQVRQRGEEAVLDALPAFERRIVHKALSEYNGVTTYSEGEEPNRRVVIAPAE